jgi:uncharacterized NAD(P)/FAD-binding protein YdhS
MQSPTSSTSKEVSSDLPVIAVIGAGFCGTMVATHLLRMIATGTLRARIVLINRPSPSQQADKANSHSTTLARGMAYGTNSRQHLLNVPAARMSAFADAPNDFIDYLLRHSHNADGSQFVPRHWYGSYLQETLAHAEAKAMATSSFTPLTVRHQTVMDILPAQSSQVTAPAYQLIYADGSTETAARVVLALGNFAPAKLPFIAEKLAHDARIINDPWQPAAFDAVRHDLPILLVGTGLTMFDVAVALRAESSTEATSTIYALSRRGLWPQAHRAQTQAPLLHDVSSLSACNRIRPLLKLLRAEVAAAAKVGCDWRDVVAGLRPITPQLWGQLPQIERRRFLRHLKPYWESHRHRAAPEIAKLVYSWASQGKIVSKASRILEIDDFAESKQYGMLRVQYRQPGSDHVLQLNVGTVINCTGPSSDLSAEPLMAALAARGIIKADPLRIGVEVDDNYRLLSAAGVPAQGLYYAGPLLRAKHWEATAVPELREHVALCARKVAENLVHS